MNKNHNVKKIFLITLIISLVISAIIGIFIILFGSFNDTEGKILLTTFLLAVFSLKGLCCSVLYEKQKYMLLATLGIATAIFGFLASLLILWELVPVFKDFLVTTIWFDVSISVTIFSFSFAHACLLLLIEPKNTIIAYILFGTLACIGIVSIMFTLLICGIINSSDHLYFKILGVFSIVDVLGTIITPILNKVYSKNENN